MQVDSTFSDSVNYLINQLRKLHLPYDEWLGVLRDYTQITNISNDSILKTIHEFPGDDDVAKKFTIETIEQTLVSLVNNQTDDRLLTNNESKALAIQLDFLMELRRHYSRRKLSRVQKIIRAAHRRVINTHIDGPVELHLRKQLESILLESR